MTFELDDIDNRPFPRDEFCPLCKERTVNRLHPSDTQFCDPCHWEHVAGWRDDLTLAEIMQMEDLHRHALMKKWRVRIRESGSICIEVEAPDEVAAHDNAHAMYANGSTDEIDHDWEIVDVEEVKQ